MKLPLFVFGALAVTSVSSAVAAPSDIVVEAEKPISIQAPLKNVVNAKGGFLEIPWDENKSNSKGRAIYQFNVKTPGTYIIWARTFWEEGCGNSVTVSVDAGTEKILGEDGTYNSWHWVGGKARFSLKKGPHTLTLRNRETGVRIDRLRFTQSGLGTQVSRRKVMR